VHRTGAGALSYALIVARGTGAFVAKIGEIVVAGVAVGPDDVDTGAGGYMNLYGGGFLSGVDGNSIGSFYVDSLQANVAERETAGRKRCWLRKPRKIKILRSKTRT
jgi:hypothetical protein